MRYYEDMKLTLFSLVFIFFFTFANSVEAQALSISVYPPIIEVQTTPPSSPTVPITIQNLEDTDVILQIQLIPLQMSPNGTGDVLFNPAALETGFYGYYKGQIQFLVDNVKTDSVTLQAQEAKQVAVNINLRKGDPPGDFYYAIVFLNEGRKLDDTSLTSIPAGIATNLLLSIGPKKPALGGITEFYTSFFKNNGPAEFELLMHNGSEHLVNPTGTITITNMLGKNVAKIDILPQYILAQSDRYLIDRNSSTSANLSLENNPKIIWNENFLLGFYTATAQIRLDGTGEILTEKVHFIAFPIYLFFGVAIVVFIAAGVYLRVRKKI